MLNDTLEVSDNNREQISEINEAPSNSVKFRKDYIKLVQLDEFPPKSRPVFVDGDCAVVVACSDTALAWGHWDVYSWGHSSGGKGRWSNVNTYKCKYARQFGCTATKKKWKCENVCKFRSNFCCSLNVNGTAKWALVYKNSHLHPVDTSKGVQVDSLDRRSQIQNIVPEVTEDSGSDFHNNDDSELEIKESESHQVDIKDMLVCRVSPVILLQNFSYYTSP